MLEILQVYSEGVIELRNSPGEHYRSSRCVFLDNRQAMPAGKLLYGADIGRVGSELFRKVFPVDMSLRLVPACKFLNSVLQIWRCAMSHEHGDFQPLSRVGLSDGSRSRNGLSVAAFELMLCHCRSLLLPRRDYVSGVGHSRIRSGEKNDGDREDRVGMGTRPQRLGRELVHSPRDQACPCV